MIDAVPPMIPVTIPLAEPTVAIAVLLLVHDPEPETSASAVGIPGQITPPPVIAGVAPFTVTTVVV